MVIAVIVASSARFQVCAIFLSLGSSVLCAKHAAAAAAATTLSLNCLALHLLGYLDVDFEEFRYAAIEADGLALVQIAFAVGVGNAFLSACVDESAAMSVSIPVCIPLCHLQACILVEHVGDHLDLGLCCCDLFRR